MMKIIRYISNMDFRCRHDGFALVAKDFDIDAKNLGAGKFVVFTNTSLTKIAIFGPNNMLAFLEHPEKRRVDLSIIPEIPNIFDGPKFSYDKALAKVFDKKLKLRKAA